MPEKHMGDLATWEKAEAALADALNEFGKPWQVLLLYMQYDSKIYTTFIVVEPG